MKVYFDDENASKEPCRDGSERLVGGFLIPPVVAVSEFGEIEIEDGVLLEESVDERDIHIGQVLAVTTGEYGLFPSPFVVSEIQEGEADLENDDTDDIDEYDRPFDVYILEYTGDREQVTDKIVLMKNDMFSSYGAGYHQYEDSRFVTGAGFSLYPVPDLLLAHVLGDDIVSKILPMSL